MRENFSLCSDDFLMNIIDVNKFRGFSEKNEQKKKHFLFLRDFVRQRL